MAGDGAPTVAEFTATGAVRISLGSAIAQVAYAVAARATTELLTDGTYRSTAHGIAYDLMNAALTSQGLCVLRLLTVTSGRVSRSVKRAAPLAARGLDARHGCHGQPLSGDIGHRCALTSGLVPADGSADTALMARWHRLGSWVAAGLAAAWVAGSVGCTSEHGQGHRHTATSAAPQVTAPAATVPAAAPCVRQQIRLAVGKFFAAWDRHERAAFGRLFPGQGELDMATAHQDTLHHRVWSSAVGPAEVAAFAARQWLLGEVLSHDGMTVYTGPYGPGYLGGAEVNDVSARFAGGAVQPIEEAKFNYNCAARAFTHVVIISAGVARKM